jgi:hypothetical protein
MKKTILTLLLVITSIITFSQTQIPTYKNAVGYWNKVTQKYDYQEWVYSDIVFTFYEKYVSVNDNNHSIYRILEDEPVYENENVKINSSKCLDETNRECTVGIMQVKGDDEQTNIGVVYDNEKMFMYMVDWKKLKEQKTPDSKDLKNLNK